MKIVRDKGRFEVTGVPRRTWDRLEAAGHAPRRVKISPVCVGWVVSELEAWVADRVQERDRRLADAKAPRYAGAAG
jgi:predicted DNA-binding transcriptional regulator AlpA